MNVEDITKRIKRVLIDQGEIDSYEPDEDHASIKPVSDFLEGILHGDSEPVIGSYLPWNKTQDKFIFRPGEVTIWAGYSGHRKSMVIGQVFLDFLFQGKSACIASLEMAPIRTLWRMVCQGVGNKNPTVDLIRKLFAYMERKLWIYDQMNSVPKERILKMARYCTEKMSLDHVVIDSLMKCGMDTDDYNAQKRFINDLCSIAKDTDKHIHLVAHLKKPPTDESYIPSKTDILGGSDMANQAHNVLIVWKNTKKQREKLKPVEHRNAKAMDEPEQRIIVDKQRNGEWEGRFQFEFDDNSLQFIEHKRIDYVSIFHV